MVKACLEETDETSCEKVIQLRQSLVGEPFKLIERLGFEGEIFVKALERLDERYGGQRRIYLALMSDIDKFRPIRLNERKDLESFARLLDEVVEKLESIGRSDELKNGFLYEKLLKKFPGKMLIDWEKRFDNKLKHDSEISAVKELLKWIQIEAEYMKRAIEILGVKEDIKQEFSKQTFCSGAVYNGKQDNFNSSNIKKHPSYKRECQNCKKDHYLDQCPEFKTKTELERQNIIRDLKLCFNCFRRNHYAQACFKPSLCRIKGCAIKHHHLLHVKPISIENKGKENISMVTKSLNEYVERQMIQLRTVPIWLLARGKSIRVNALLDDASNCSYISEIMAEELKLPGEWSRRTVEVIGGRTKFMQAKEVEVTLQSDDKRQKETVSLLAVRQPTGSMRAANWDTEKQNWRHLREIPFPSLEKRKQIDVLLGADYIHLQRALVEVSGNIGEPIARLTPLGWTCVGRSIESETDKRRSHCTRTFCAYVESLDTLVERFCGQTRPARRETSCPAAPAARASRQSRAAGQNPSAPCPACRARCGNWPGVRPAPRRPARRPLAAG